MNIHVEPPTHITGADLTNNTRSLRALASSNTHFALPLKLKRTEEVGILCSMDAASAFLGRRNVPLSSVSSLKTFEQGLASLVQTPMPSDTESASLVTIGQKPNAPATGLVFYQGPKTRELICFAQSYQNGGTRRTRYPFPVVNSLNSDHDHVEAVLSRELRGHPEKVLPTIEANGVVVQNDRNFAALSRSSALQLKAAMFPCNGHIIRDITASDANQRFGAIKEDIETGKAFARIVLKDRWQNAQARDMTLIPGYALEFLELDDNGTVTGVRNSTSVLISLEMEAVVDTDFTESTRFRINSKAKGQLAIVERALSQLRETNGTILLQGQQKTLTETGRERRIHGTQGHIKFDTTLGVSFLLHSNGNIQDFTVGTGQKNALVKSSITIPTTINMVFRGRNYTLAPTN